VRVPGFRFFGFPDPGIPDVLDSHLIDAPTQDLRRQITTGLVLDILVINRLDKRKHFLKLGHQTELTPQLRLLGIKNLLRLALGRLPL